MNNIINFNQCNIIKINKKQYNKFQSENAIIESKSGDTIFGLEFNGLLVATMNIRNGVTYYIEKNEYTVPNGLMCLISYYGKPVEFFDDLRYSISEQLIGFKFIDIVNPEYKYTKNNKLYSKFCYPINKFKIYDPSLDPRTNMLNNGFFKIWDAGYGKYIYYKGR